MVIISRYYLHFCLVAVVLLGVVTYSLGTAGGTSSKTTLGFGDLRDRITEHNTDYRILSLEKEEAEEALEDMEGLLEEMETQLAEISEFEFSGLLDDLLDSFEQEEKELRRGVSRLNYEKKMTAEILTRQAEELFYLYFTLKGEEAVLRENLELLRELFYLKKEKRKQGMVTWQEIERAVIQVEQGQLLLNSVKEQRKDLLNEIKLLTGYELNTQLELIAPPEPDKEALNLRDAIDQAVNEGLNVKMHERQYELSDKGEKEQLALEQARQKARSQVEKEFRSVKLAEEAYRLADRSLDLARRNLERMEARHEAGLVDGVALMEMSLKLMEVHQDHYEAALDYERAKNDFRLAKEGVLIKSSEGIR